ncbi:C2H2 type zinc finger domain protein [Apiospora arundinis]
MDQLPSWIDLCMFPAGTPPPGTVTDFDNSETLVPVLIAICALMTVVVVVFATCRLYANKKELRWSDCKGSPSYPSRKLPMTDLPDCMAIALVFSLAHTGLMLAQTKYARHQWDVRACWYNGSYTKILFAQQVLLTLVLFFSKVSIFLLFQQIFEVQKSTLMAIRFGIAFTALLYFTNIPMSAILSAPHVGETWTSVLFSGRPQKDLIWGVVQSSLGIILDLFIFVLPIPVIMRLQLSTKRKIQILAVFTTALVVVENDVAIFVSCAPGFAKFTRVYISEPKILQSIRSNLRRNKRNEGESLEKLPVGHDKADISKRKPAPRVQAAHDFDTLSDTATYGGTSTAERGFVRPHGSHTSTVNT